MLSKLQKKSLLLKVVNLCQKEVKELKMETNLELRTTVHQRMN